MTDAASDETLLGRVAERDVDALTELYDRHRAVAYGLALRVTRSVPLAEDAVQDAFLGAWRQASGFDAAKGSGRAWLLAIVHHRSVDAVRRRRLADPLPEVDSGPAPPSLVAPDVWPEVAGRLDAEAVRRALDAIPVAQRESIELAYWGGLTQAEISHRTGLPLGTVKGRMRLGLQALGRALRDDARFGGGDAAGAPSGTSAAFTEAIREDGVERSVVARCSRLLERLAAGLCARGMRGAMA